LEDHESLLNWSHSSVLGHNYIQRNRSENIFLFMLGCCMYFMFVYYHFADEICEKTWFTVSDVAGTKPVSAIFRPVNTNLVARTCVLSSHFYNR
jgi:hypothetical protein